MTTSLSRREPRSRIKSQAPGSRSSLEAPVYTRDELEEKLARLEKRLSPVFEAFIRMENALLDLWSSLYNEKLITQGELMDLSHRRSELEEYVLGLIGTIVARELQLDTDVEKYEKHYKVKFRLRRSERPAGVVMLKDEEDGIVKPVVVWISYYGILRYEEGEKQKE